MSRRNTARPDAAQVKSQACESRSRRSLLPHPATNDICANSPCLGMAQQESSRYARPHFVLVLPSPPSTSTMTINITLDIPPPLPLAGLTSKALESISTTASPPLLKDYQASRFHWTDYYWKAIPRTATHSTPYSQHTSQLTHQPQDASLTRLTRSDQPPWSPSRSPSTS